MSVEVEFLSAEHHFGNPNKERDADRDRHWSADGRGGTDVGTPEKARSTAAQLVSATQAR
jgi:hypothetical protein